MKLSNYCFFHRDTEEVVPKAKVGDVFSLRGAVTGNPNFDDDDIIITSEIIELHDDHVITESRSRYELGQMHPDYIELNEAYDRGVPILNKWHLFGNRHDGYSMSGYVGGKLIRGKVNGQRGNYVTIDGTEYLVIWCNPNFDEGELLDIQRSHRYCDIYMVDFERYMDQFIRLPLRI